MRKARLVVLTAILLAVFAMPSQARCPFTPDGLIVCNARCIYPNICEGGAGGYCFIDQVVNVCFDGDYDPCCAPHGGF